VLHGWRSLPLAAAIAALPIAGQAAYATFYFGSPLGSGYGDEATQGWSTPLAEGVAGLLVSPGRGLVLYAPWLVFAAVALFRGDPALFDRRASRLLLAAIGSLILLMGKWWCWWGAGGPGERMTSDVAPLWGVGLVLAWKRFADHPRWRPWWLVSCGYALAMHVLITCARPYTQTTELFYWTISGAWTPRAFAPVAYILGLIAR
jgi:hypothetical protein